MRKLSAHVSQGCCHPQTQKLMIYSVSVVLKDIFALGKDFPWERPSSCPRCGHYRLWGHGYVPRYFRGFSSCLYLKCFRCPSCCCVLTLRPDSHYPRIRTCVAVIREHVFHRDRHGHWPRSDLARSNLRYWWKNLKSRALVYLDNRFTGGMSAAFELLPNPVNRLR